MTLMTVMAASATGVRHRWTRRWIMVFVVRGVIHVRPHVPQSGSSPWPGMTRSIST